MTSTAAVLDAAQSTDALRDVPHPSLTAADQADIARAASRYIVATGGCLAAVVVGAGLSAVLPALGVPLILVAYLTGVVVFSRRLALTHPHTGSRFRGRPLTVRVNAAAAAAYQATLDTEVGIDGATPEDSPGDLLLELAALTRDGAGETAAASELTERIVALADRPHSPHTNRTV